MTSPCWGPWRVDPARELDRGPLLGVVNERWEAISAMEYLLPMGTSDVHRIAIADR
jgi:hypothetical protein